MFWGLTEYGVELLGSFDYFRYVPILEALQASVERSEELERHLRAPRPSLPERIAEAFRGEGFDEEALESAERDALGV